MYYTVEEVEVLTGYIVIEDNELHFRHVIIVKMEDKERMEELNLTEEDMPNGYAIIRKKEESTMDFSNHFYGAVNNIWHIGYANLLTIPEGYIYWRISIPMQLIVIIIFTIIAYIFSWLLKKRMLRKNK